MTSTEEWCYMRMKIVDIRDHDEVTEFCNVLVEDEDKLTATILVWRGTTFWQNEHDFFTVERRLPARVKFYPVEERTWDWYYKDEPLPILPSTVRQVTIGDAWFELHTQWQKISRKIRKYSKMSLPLYSTVVSLVCDWLCKRV